MTGFLVWCWLIASGDEEAFLKAAIEKPLIEHHLFIPPVGNWRERAKLDQRADVITMGWLCGAKTVTELQAIWELSEHVLVYEQAVSQAVKQRFTGFPRDGRTQDISGVRVLPVVEAIRRQRETAAGYFVGQTLWEWKHARLRAQWKAKTPHKLVQARPWEAEIDDAYGEYVPKEMSEELNARISRRYRAWVDSTKRRGALDYGDTQRVFRLLTDWAKSLPNRGVAVANTLEMLDKMFVAGANRYTRPATANDVRPLLRALDDFLLTLFPKMDKDEIDVSLMNVIAALQLDDSHQAEAQKKLEQDFELLRQLRRRLVAIKEQ